MGRHEKLGSASNASSIHLAVGILGLVWAGCCMAGRPGIGHTEGLTPSRMHANRQGATRRMTRSEDG